MAQKDYVNPYEGVGGKINTMERFKKMEEGAAAPAPAKKAEPAKADPKKAAPKKSVEKESIDALMRSMRETSDRAEKQTGKK
jgi:hypothetical protein